jgi:pimeloyl-ACP methyl ester carboxylesterase
VAVNGVNLAVEVRGDGPAILFIHGYPLDHTLWAHQLGHLEGYQRIAPDLRGMGQSDAPDLGYSMATYADDLLALLNTLGVGKVVLCGVSMGGYVAFEILRRARERVRGLVLLGSRAEADTPEGRKGRDAAAAQAREGGAAAVAAAMLPRLLPPVVQQREPALADRLTRMMAATPLAGILGALAALRDRPDSLPLLPTLGGIPTMIVVGSEDEITPVDRARVMAEGIPGARLEVLAGAGHLCPLERPEEVTALVADFLAGLGSGL